ncbi:uncharacterized protein LOC136072385 [Hydra vulgaris]|uniref:uncharacterized protein LOC136072385 n=1 Tax=Hydra vulgaris TaxID=6087 RepID=UPI0032EA0E55
MKVASEFVLLELKWKGAIKKQQDLPELALKAYKQCDAFQKKDYELKKAVELVNDGEPCKRVARLLNIQHRTLRCHVSGLRKTSVVGRRSALLPEGEVTIAQYIATFSDFGYAFEIVDLKLFIQSFLQKSGRDCPYFKEHLPGNDWVRSFLKRHKKLLSYRACQNICRKRAAVICDSVNRFFSNLEETIKKFLPQNIINYDKTNLSDDPKSKQMIFRKGTKHAKRVMNTSKSSVSIIFACSADGVFLSPYTVYKAERLMDTWILGGPMDARYNRTKSGWFDSHCFIDWMQTLVIPYFRHVDNDALKILIGDNLACHLSIEVIEICEANNILMVFLPPNSTHLLQPLDLAVYGPIKSTWRKVLTAWKIGEGRFHTSLPKNVFPRLLPNLIYNMDHIQEFAVHRFKTSGIYPLNRKKIIKKILRADISTSSQNLVSPLVLKRLKELREASAKKPGTVLRGKKVKVSPGKSVSLDDLAVSSVLKSQSKR